MNHNLQQEEEGLLFMFPSVERLQYETLEHVFLSPVSLSFSGLLRVSESISRVLKSIKATVG